MNDNIYYVWSVQQGSSSTLRVTDEFAWYVYYEIWEGMRLLSSRIHTRHKTRSEALASLYDATETPLNVYPMYITAEYLGGDATDDDALRMAELLRARGWDVKVGPAPRPHPWEEEPVVTVEDWEEAWRECLKAL